MTITTSKTKAMRCSRKPDSQVNSSPQLEDDSIEWVPTLAASLVLTITIPRISRDAWHLRIPTLKSDAHLEEQKRINNA
jgi:hypothetical protein